MVAMASGGGGSWGEGRKEAPYNFEFQFILQVCMEGTPFG